jgi:hypothetical protein
MVADVMTPALPQARLPGRRQWNLSPGRESNEAFCQALANVILVRVPIHASWLNQIDIYFSILQRRSSPE